MNSLSPSLCLLSLPFPSLSPFFPICLLCSVTCFFQTPVPSAAPRIQPNHSPESRGGGVILRAERTGLSETLPPPWRSLLSLSLLCTAFEEVPREPPPTSHRVGCCEDEMRRRVEWTEPPVTVPSWGAGGGRGQVRISQRNSSELGHGIESAEGIVRAQPQGKASSLLADQIHLSLQGDRQGTGITKWIHYILCFEVHTYWNEQTWKQIHCPVLRWRV